MRARVRRRRARRNVLVAAAVTMVLATGPALWYQSTRGEPPRPPSGGGVVPSVKVDNTLTWWMARLDRTGTKVTLYVTRPPEGIPCEGTWSPQAVTEMDADVVTVSVEDASAGGMGCPGSNSLAPLRITLPQPLGNRTLADGFDGGSRPVFREADLPEVPQGPDGWSEVNTTFGANPGSEGLWTVGYTRGGGPDIRIYGYPPDQAPSVAADPVDTVEVAGARGTIYPRSINHIGYELRWEASGVVYFLELSPTEGEKISLQLFRDVLTRLGIS